MRKSTRQIGKKLRITLGLLVAFGLPLQAGAYVISDLGGTPTEGWDGPGLGAATINYYLGWSGEPGGTNGLTFGSLPIATVEAELANAMATWSSVVDVTFNYLGNAINTPSLAANPWGTAANPTLVVLAHTAVTADGIPFDGAGLFTVFAHAWGPPDIMGGTGFEFAGNIHMDGDENWLTGLADGTTYASQGGIDLETIFLHELGHSLGLGHDPLGAYATVGGPVMAEYSNIALSTLGADDIAGVRQLYSFQGQDWSNGDPGNGCDPADETCEPDGMTVAEPGTLFLFGIGLLALAGCRRRSLSRGS